MRLREFQLWPLPGAGVAQERTAARMLGAGLISGAVGPLAISCLQLRTALGFGLAVFLLGLGLFGGALLGDLMYNRWGRASAQGVGVTQPRPLFVRTLRVVVLVIVVVLAILMAQYPWREFDAVNVALLTLAFAPLVAVLAFDSRSYIFALINLGLFLLDMIYFVGASSWIPLVAAWVCLVMAAAAFLFGREVYRAQTLRKPTPTERGQ